MLSFPVQTSEQTSIPYSTGALLGPAEAICGSLRVDLDAACFGMHKIFTKTP